MEGNIWDRMCAEFVRLTGRYCTSGYDYYCTGAPMCAHVRVRSDTTHGRDTTWGLASIPGKPMLLALGLRSVSVTCLLSVRDVYWDGCDRPAYTSNGAS
jgi:hypothetical protein